MFDRSLLSVTLLLAGTLLLSACDYDNYEPPGSTLEGAVVYQGEPVGVRQGAVEFELWEPGYQLDDYIPVNVHQDGTFSAKLFAGAYKLVRKDGPWVTNTDTITVEVSGTKTIEVPVTPFFVISNATITLEGSTVTATFDVEQVVDERSLQSVALFVNGTRFVDRLGDGNFASAALNAEDLDDLNGIELSIDLTSGQTQGRKAVFARIGVQTQGVQDWLYSQVTKLEL